MKICDLHTHSTFSDGTCTPEELVDLACAAGLSAIALTDHNTVDGLERMSRAAEGRIELCRGCEITTQADGQELHLLGLFLDPARTAPIRELIAAQLQRKEQSNRETVERIAELGYLLSYDEFVEKYGTGSKNRVHIAKYLLEKGVVQSRKEAFDRLLDPKAGIYLPPEKLDFFQMIRLVREIGGAAVWAHPLFHVDRVACERLLPRAKECGLDGVEVYYCTYSEDDTVFMREMCEKYGLLESGGSDFHGENKPGLLLGTGYGSLCIPYSCYEALKRLADSRRERP